MSVSHSYGQSPIVTRVDLEAPAGIQSPQNGIVVIVTDQCLKDREPAEGKDRWVCR